MSWPPGAKSGVRAAVSTCFQKPSSGASGVAASITAGVEVSLYSSVAGFASGMVSVSAFARVFGLVAASLPATPREAPCVAPAPDLGADWLAS